MFNDVIIPRLMLGFVSKNHWNQGKHEGIFDNVRGISQLYEMCTSQRCEIRFGHWFFGLFQYPLLYRGILIPAANLFWDIHLIEFRMHYDRRCQP
jgi:hypothetical protein